jgi:predicted permease
MSTLWRDVRYGFRQLLKSPGFTGVAVVTLALGITVNAVVFSFANDLFLRPLPARAPHEIVVIVQKSPKISYQLPFSYVDAVDLRHMVEASEAGAPDMTRVFADLMAYSERSVHLSRPGESTERAWIHAVTDNYFGLLGTQPRLGRFFLPGEVQRPGAEPVIVLTHDTWRHRFDADPSVIGQIVKLNGLPFIIVGVAPPGFLGASWGTAISGFVPVTMLHTLVGPHVLDRGNSLVFVMGRLKPGAGLRQAQAAMDVAMSRLIQANPVNYLASTRAVVIPERASRPSPYISHHVPAIIAALMILALLVLAVAGANVANLQYARAASREHEFAVRSAIGASRCRLLCEVLMESVLVALGAGAVGVIASLWLVPLVAAALPTPEGIAPAADAGVDWRPFVFGFILSLLAGVGAGLMPALKATGLAIQPLLQNNLAALRGRRHPMRSLLTIGQVGVSVVVLVCAGMAVRSLWNLLDVRMGFDPHNLVVASFDLEKQRYEADRGRQFCDRLLGRVHALPGVQAASLADHTPLDTRAPILGGVVPEGQTVAEHMDDSPVTRVVAERTILQALGIPLVAGREFTTQDGPGAPLVAVINQALADRFWPGEDPIGKRISLQGDVVEVVGLVGEMRYDDIKNSRRPLLIQPLAQNYRGRITLVIRTTGSAAALISAMEAVVRQLDPDLPLLDVQTVEHRIATSPVGLLPYRMGAALAGAQGFIALLLAGLGIFGLVSFNVTRRFREIGLRMALGATQASVLWMIAREMLVLTFIGLFGGVILSIMLTRSFTGLLYDVSPVDGLVLVSVITMVLGAALLAVCLPARRAARIDPMAALRCE